MTAVTYEADMETPRPRGAPILAQDVAASGDSGHTCASHIEKVFSSEFPITFSWGGADIKSPVMPADCLADLPKIGMSAPASTEALGYFQPLLQSTFS